MQRNLDALQAKLEAYELDDPSAVDPVNRRLARENGWSSRYARRVLDESPAFAAHGPLPPLLP